MACEAPVTFFIFNRPQHTARVWEAIRAARPSKLLLVADGPRETHPTDSDRCAATRAIVETIDWPCEVSRNFSEINLGCGRRISSGIDWVFSQVDSAIMLEDDCLPNASFFRFSSELLAKYRDEPRVMHVSGSSFIPSRLCRGSSYYYSRYSFIWGWATWARAWAKYDYNVSGIEEELPTLLRSLRLRGEAQQSFYTTLIARFRAGKVDTWDFQWNLACIRNAGLCITPCCNLVSNTGFGPDATHTGDSASRLGNRPTQELNPIVHPQSFKADEKADRYSMAYLLPPRKGTWGSAVRGLWRQLAHKNGRAVGPPLASS